jgi:hypothetical protein
MEESTNLIFRFLTSHVGFGPTVKPQIAVPHAEAQNNHISWCDYADRVAGLVTDRSLYGQIMHYYRLQAIGWSLTILAAILG